MSVIKLIRTQNIGNYFFAMFVVSEFVIIINTLKVT